MFKRKLSDATEKRVKLLTLIKLFALSLNNPLNIKQSFHGNGKTFVFPQL